MSITRLVHSRHLDFIDHMCDVDTVKLAEKSVLYARHEQCFFIVSKLSDGGRYRVDSRA